MGMNIRLLSKLASIDGVLGDLGAQDRSVLDVHEDLSTKSTTQSATEVEFRKKSINEMRPCKVAVIGAGNMAQEHLKAFADIPNVELVGIFSRSKDRATALAAQFNIPIVADDVANLYEISKPDLVVVTVYETSMLEVALKCMHYPWTIFLEKPPGYNLDQAKEIEAAAQSRGRKVIVGLNRRFLSSTQKVANSLQKVEGPRFVSVFDQQSLKTARAFNHSDIVLQYWMYANSIHLVDYLSFFCRGEVDSLIVDNDWRPDETIVINASLLYSSGDRALYQATWEAPGPWAVNVITKDIRWEMRPLEKAAYQLDGDRQVHQVELSAWDENFKPGFRLQAEQSVRCALGQDSSSPTIADAVKTMKIINDIYKR